MHRIVSWIDLALFFLLIGFGLWVVACQPWGSRPVPSARQGARRLLPWPWPCPWGDEAARAAPPWRNFIVPTLQRGNASHGAPAPRSLQNRNDSGAWHGSCLVLRDERTLL